MDFIYFILPFFTWLVTGFIKFIVNTFKEKRLAFDLIGYGGMPSNHSSIVSSMAAMVALNEGISSPAFGVALAFSYIVILDASSLRIKIGQQAAIINKIAIMNGIKADLRERIGHTRSEIIAGVVLGVSISVSVFYIFLT